MKVNYLKQRHIGLSEQDEQKMLKVIGAESVEQLIAETMPEDILLKEPIELPEPLTEQQMLDSLTASAQANVLNRSYIGRGWYGTITPSVIRRNVLLGCQMTVLSMYRDCISRFDK